MNDYAPNSLPRVDAVEVVDLRQINANRVEYMENAIGAPRVRLDGELAQMVADAWRALLPGESARCHLPSIGYRFICEETLILEASVCWRCNNLFGIENGNEIAYAFDSESETAKRLLELAQEAIGDNALLEG